MTRLLRIDASARQQQSYSRELADFFQQQWLSQYPQDSIIVRDLVTQPVPHIDNATIEGFHIAPQEQDEVMKNATALSDKLIAELMSADVLLISTPMYNFSIPSVLKAYIDQIVRVGHTIGFDEKGLFGLIKNKKAYVMISCGAVYSDTPLAKLDFVKPYLQALLGFLGFSDIQFFQIEGATRDEKMLVKSKQAALQRIEQIISNKDS